MEAIDELLPKIKRIIDEPGDLESDQPVDLEQFLTELGDGYHPNGHMVVGNGAYSKIDICPGSALIGRDPSGLCSHWCQQHHDLNQSKHSLV